MKSMRLTSTPSYLNFAYKLTIKLFILTETFLACVHNSVYFSPNRKTEQHTQLPFPSRQKSLVFRQQWANRTHTHRQTTVLL